MEEALERTEDKNSPEEARNRPLRPAEQASHDIQPFLFGQRGGASAEQLEVIQALHAVLARSLTDRASAHLQTELAAHLMAVEQIDFADFEQRLAKRSYLATLNLDPLQGIGILDFDLVIAFPMIDLLLGGHGKIDIPERDLTEIEELMIQNVIQIILEELQAAWRSLVSVRFSLGQRTASKQLATLRPANERTLAVRLEVEVSSQRGTLTLGFPASVTSALVRAIKGRPGDKKRHLSPQYVAERKRRVENCSFSLEMRLPQAKAPAEDLLYLRPGETLALPLPVDKPALIQVAERDMFAAYPVRVGKVRGGQITHRMAQTGASSESLRRERP